MTIVNGRPIKILAVEDSENDFRLAMRVLRKAGFAPEAQRVQDLPSLRQALLDGRSQLVTFHFRHGIIRNDQVEPALLKQGQGFFAAAGRLNLVPVILKHHLDGFADSGFVVHHQNLPSLISHCRFFIALQEAEYYAPFP